MAPKNKQCLGFWGPVWELVMALEMSENCFSILSVIVRLALGAWEWVLWKTFQKTLLCVEKYEKGLVDLGPSHGCEGNLICRVHWHHMEVFSILAGLYLCSEKDCEAERGPNACSGLSNSGVLWAHFCFLLSQISNCIPSPLFMWLSAPQINHVQIEIPSFPCCPSPLISSCFTSWVFSVGNVSLTNHYWNKSQESPQTHPCPSLPVPY